MEYCRSIRITKITGHFEMLVVIRVNIPIEINLFIYIFKEFFEENIIHNYVDIKIHDDKSDLHQSSVYYH